MAALCLSSVRGCASSQLPLPQPLQGSVDALLCLILFLLFPFPSAIIPWLSLSNFPQMLLKKMSAQGGKNEEIWHRKRGWEMDFGPWEMNSQMGALQPTSWRVVLLLMEDMLCGMYSIKVTNGDHILNIIYVEQAPCEEIMQQYLMMAMIQQVIGRNSP